MTAAPTSMVASVFVLLVAACSGGTSTTTAPTAEDLTVRALCVTFGAVNGAAELPRPGGRGIARKLYNRLPDPGKALAR